jgi:ketosteroid isomerase-like protein
MPRRAAAADKAGHERLARELWSAVAEGDADSLRRLLAPDVVWRSIGLNPLSGDYRGPDDVVAYFAEIGHRVDELSSNLEQIWTGTDGAIVGYRVTARRGAETLEMDYLMRIRIRDGLIAGAVVIPLDQRVNDDFWI